MNLQLITPDSQAIRATDATAATARTIAISSSANSPNPSEANICAISVIFFLLWLNKKSPVSWGKRRFLTCFTRGAVRVAARFFDWFGSNRWCNYLPTPRLTNFAPRRKPAQARRATPPMTATAVTTVVSPVSKSEKAAVIAAAIICPRSFACGVRSRAGVHTASHARSA